jgi:cephalosporin hydroxylase
MDDPISAFQAQRRDIIATNSDPGIVDASAAFLRESVARNYSYNFDWLSRPIIQYPQDMVAMQELIWSVRPDLIIETGIAHGGSAVFSASMLALLDYCDAAAAGEMLDPAAPRRRVLAIDIDIRAHNRALIEAHPLANRIDMIEGSSVDDAVVAQALAAAEQAGTVLVCLDSNHTADHVLAELEAYAPMTSQGSYCVVFDTVVEDLPAEMFGDRPWGPGNSPKTAVFAYLDRLDSEGRNGIDGAPLYFGIDRGIDRKLLISVAPDGFLRRRTNEE